MFLLLRLYRLNLRPPGIILLSVYGLIGTNAEIVRRLLRQTANLLGRFFRTLRHNRLRILRKFSISRVLDLIAACLFLLFLPCQGYAVGLPGGSGDRGFGSLDREGFLDRARILSRERNCCGCLTDFYIVGIGDGVVGFL